VAGGLISVVFAKLLLGIRERFLRFPKNTVWFHPVAGGLLVGLMGLVRSAGPGRGVYVRRICFECQHGLDPMLLLLVLKLLAVTTS